MVERGYTFLEQTGSFCPKCMKRIPAKIIEKEGSIFLLKSCPTHGNLTDILQEDAAWFKARKSFDKPGTFTQPQTKVKRRCPFDCGLCPDHEQHTCIGLIEVTNACDLGCPVCYASSGKGNPLPLKKCVQMMDFFQESEGGKAEILQISGGEPTTHPQIIEIIQKAKERKFRYVMLNTNGLKIAQDETFVQELSKFRNGFEIYLQFDGFNPSSSLALRGKDLSKIKIQAISHLAKYKIPITLVSTVERGVNDDELGAIIDFGLKTFPIRGINFQHLAFFGRRKNHNTSNRLTLTGILKGIQQQMKGMLNINDFIPLPCNVERVAVTYLYRKKDEFIPITRSLKVQNYLQFLDNTFAFDGDRMLSKVKSEMARRSAVCCNFISDLKPLLPLNYVKKSEDEKTTFVEENTFRITVTSFLDAYNFDIASMKKECVHVITPDLKRIPFSAYNMIHRKKYSHAA